MSNINIFQGRRVLNTRPAEQSLSLSKLIETAGGQSINIPTLAIKPTASKSWLQNLPILSKIQQTIFTSRYAANYFFDGLEQSNLSWPTSINVISIGQGTAETLCQRGIQVNETPSNADSEHLLALPSLSQISHQTLLLVKGEGGRTLIPTVLIERGALLSIANVYCRTLPQNNQKKLSHLWQIDGIDMIVFTSQEAMNNLFTLLDKQAHAWLRNKPCVVISNRLSEAAAALGMKTIYHFFPLAGEEVNAKKH